MHETWWTIQMIGLTNKQKVVHQFHTSFSLTKRIRQKRPNRNRHSSKSRRVQTQRQLSFSFCRYSEKPLITQAQQHEVVLQLDISGNFAFVQFWVKLIVVYVFICRCYRQAGLWSGGQLSARSGPVKETLNRCYVCILLILFVKFMTL